MSFVQIKESIETAAEETNRKQRKLSRSVGPVELGAIAEPTD